MRKALFAFASGIALMWPQIAFAAGEGGCEDFAWSIEAERALMAAADPVEAASAANLGSIPEKAIAVTLAPNSGVAYLVAPTGKPKDAGDETYGAVIKFDGAGGGGPHQVTVSTSAWVDLIQNGAALKSTAHTGKSGCEGVRKSVRFTIAPGPFAIQISGASIPAIRLTVRPAASAGP